MKKIYERFKNLDKSIRKKIALGIVLCIVVCLIGETIHVKTAFNNVYYEGNPSNLKTDNVEYTYNTDLINILCLGIDKEGDITLDQNVGYRGQSDAIYLVSFDRKTSKISVMNIPRDTMVNIDMYNSDGDVVATSLQQITLQHAYGTSEEKSCELMTKQVSSLLNGIPIHRYVSISFDAIPDINDAIGGVDVKMDDNYVDDTLKAFSEDFREGNTVHLDGDLAYDYLRIRDVTTYGSAEERANRQMTYIQAFITKAKSQIKSNPLTLFTLFSKVSNVMDTNISYSDMIALYPFITNFSLENIYTVPGTRYTGGQYEEYYVDTDQLVPMLEQVYYKQK